MSQNNNINKPKAVNVRQIFLNGHQQIGIYQVCAKYKISEKSAILLALSRGLYAEGFMSEDDFKKDFENYGKPLTEKIEAKKEKREKTEKALGFDVLPENVRNALLPFMDCFRIEETETNFILYPIRQIEQEQFKNVAPLIRNLNGSYVSERNNSHFRIPKEVKK